ncbi:MAG: DUF2155 domain-containing protein [Paracoccaceae bacterium]
MRRLAPALAAAVLATAPTGASLVVAPVAALLDAAPAAAQRIETVPLDDPGATDGTLLPNGARSRRRDAVPGGPDEDGDRFVVAPFRTEAYPDPPRAIAIGETRRFDAARLRVLDMITGETSTIEIAVGRQTEHRRLTLALRTCARPERGSVGDLAALEVVDRRLHKDVPAFSGWMFAESPALSALDHPRYDVWLIACTTASAGEGEGSE